MPIYIQCHVLLGTVDYDIGKYKLHLSYIYILLTHLAAAKLAFTRIYSHLLCSLANLAWPEMIGNCRGSELVNRINASRECSPGRKTYFVGIKFKFLVLYDDILKSSLRSTKYHLIGSNHYLYK